MVPKILNSFKILYFFPLGGCDGLSDLSWCRDEVWKSRVTGEWPCVTDTSGYFKQSCKKICCEQELGSNDGVPLPPTPSPTKSPTPDKGVPNNGNQIDNDASAKGKDMKEADLK